MGSGENINKTNRNLLNSYANIHFSLIFLQRFKRHIKKKLHIIVQILTASISRASQKEQCALKSNKKIKIGKFQKQRQNPNHIFPLEKKKIFFFLCEEKNIKKKPKIQKREKDVYNVTIFELQRFPFSLSKK